MPPYGVMFHHFRDHRHPAGQGAISAEEMDDIIRAMGVEKFLPAEEWIRRAQAGTLGDDDLCLTFDDALRCQFDVGLPVLRHYGLTACWFIYSSVFEGNVEPLEIYRYFRTTEYQTIDAFYDDFFALVREALPTQWAAAMQDFDPDRYLADFPFYSRGDRIFRYLRDQVLGESYDAMMRLLMERKGFDQAAVAGLLWMDDANLREMRAEGHVVGLHSYSHPTRLGALPTERQEEEYARNMAHIAGVLGEKPICVSHPCNSYDARTLPILRKLGVEVGFRANMSPVEGRCPLQFPREDHMNILKALRS